MLKLYSWLSQPLFWAGYLSGLIIKPFFFGLTTGYYYAENKTNEINEENYEIVYNTRKAEDDTKRGG